MSRPTPKEARTHHDLKCVGELTGAWNLLFRLLLVSFPVMATFIGWLTVNVVSIKSNRFTSSDGLAVWKALKDIQTDMAKVPREVPPAWFKAEVDAIKANQVEMHEELHRFQIEIINRLNKLNGGP